MNKLKTTTILNKFTENKIYHIHNDKGLGDSVFNIIFFNIIKDYIVKNNIKIYYYTKNIYIKQLYEFITIHQNIFLLPLFTKPKFSLELWINNKFFRYTHEDTVLNSNTRTIYYNKFYKNFFNIVLKKLNFNISVNKLAYYDKDLLTRYDVLPNKYKNFDILIINSQPNSGQYDYNKNSWDNYIIELNSQFKILTTTKVHGVLCTYDDNLTIKDIASLSTRAKIIIAINSGVVPGLLNYYTLTNLKHFYNFDNRCFYSYPNFENRKNNITDISFDELRRYLNCDATFGISIDNIVE
jgi:hypothetical protein